MSYPCHHHSAAPAEQGRRRWAAGLRAGVSRHPTSTRGLIAGPWTPLASLCCRWGTARSPPPMMDDVLDLCVA